MPGRIIPAENLIKIFGGNIPAYALEFAEKADEMQLSDEEVLASLKLMKAAKDDPRVQRALTIAREVYAEPGKSFTETYPPEDQAKIQIVLARVFISVFADLDERAKAEKEKAGA